MFGDLIGWGNWSHKSFQLNYFKFSIYLFDSVLFEVFNWRILCLVLVYYSLCFSIGNFLAHNALGILILAAFFNSPLFRLLKTVELYIIEIHELQKTIVNSKMFTILSGILQEQCLHDWSFFLIWSQRVMLFGATSF